MATPSSLANYLGEPSNISPLWIKAKRLGAANCQLLEDAAIARGCFHYASGETLAETETRDLSDEEIAILLVLPQLPYSQRRIRIASQLLSADRVDSNRLIRLARLERVEHVVRYIAECGAATEPDNPRWAVYLRELSNKRFPRERLPHISRFRAETGIVRPGSASRKIQWLRARDE